MQYFIKVNILFDLLAQGWRSGESTRLPPDLTSYMG